jgi:COMPASS component SWD3
MKTMNVLTST